MGNRVNRLVLSVVGLLISLVLLGGATYAWFAISTTPEIFGISATIAAANESLPFELSLDGENWTTTLDMTALFDDADVLRPISTADGENWYIPIYDANGSVNDFFRIPASSIDGYANTGDADTNYLVYADIYIRTSNQNQDSFGLVLSNPSSLDTVQDEETSYGTFVLYQPTVDDDGDIQTNDAMAALRIGFEIFDEVDASTSLSLIDEDAETAYASEGTFYIYEPNADMRSADLATIAQSQTANLDYIYGNEIQPKDYNDYKEEVQETSVPQYVENADGTSTFEMVVVDTIQQYTSAWDLTALQTLFDGGGTTYDSTYIDSIGAFVDTTPIMTTVSYGEVKKIRIYLWLEGQDIDCWNQIAGGNIYANLEFTSRDSSETTDKTEAEITENAE